MKSIFLTFNFSLFLFVCCLRFGRNLPIILSEIKTFLEKETFRRFLTSLSYSAYSFFTSDIIFFLFLRFYWSLTAEKYFHNNFSIDERIRRIASKQKDCLNSLFETEKKVPELCHHLRINIAPKSFTNSLIWNSTNPHRFDNVCFFFSYRCRCLWAKTPTQARLRRKIYMYGLFSIIRSWFNKPTTEWL